MARFLHHQLIWILIAWTELLDVLKPSHGLASAGGSKNKPQRRSSSGGGGFGASSSSIRRPSELLEEPDNSPEIAELLDYLKSQKADVENVAVGFHPLRGRGLYATKTFSKTQGGQTLCRIPSDCALALSDPGQAKQQQLSEVEEGANLLQLYLRNSERSAQFAPYLNTLPTEISDPTPNLFDEKDELPLLEFPRIIQKSKQRNEKMTRVLQEQSSEQQQISLQELQYATWLVTSRSFPLAVSQDGESVAAFDDRGQVLTQPDRQRQFIRVLVPLLDMVNHSHNNKANARMVILDPQKDSAWFALESTRPIPAGTEICISYGSGVATSLDLLLNYGFVPTATPHNQFDSLMLQKGGDDCFSSISDWSTTLEEDEAMLQMISQQQEEKATATPASSSKTLAEILTFRIQLKKAYKTE